MEDLNFYTKLKTSDKALIDFLDDESAFSAVPRDWNVVVVDVKNSTQSVAEGKHHQVNLVATGAIISVLNTVRLEDKRLQIPYFFGGDGATFIVPPLVVDNVMQVLVNFSQHIKRKVNLVLRVGCQPVDSFKLTIAKHQLTDQLTIPVVLGNGLKDAEEIIKNKFVESTISDFEPDLLHLEGMECRWKQINPVQIEKKVVCLLLESTSEEGQAKVYKEVLARLEDLFGAFGNRQPIKSSNLNLDLRFRKIWREMKIRLARKSILYLTKNWFSTLLGKWYLKRNANGKQYLGHIANLSHTLMIDGMISTIFTGNQREIDQFTAYLEEKEKENSLVFGMHVTHASIMSCYVLDRRSKHTHFVDGTEGGYTSAAKMLKLKKKG